MGWMSFQPAALAPSRSNVSGRLGRSLASIASFADDVRSARHATPKWQFVDIPIESNTYELSGGCSLTKAIVPSPNSIV